MTAPMTAHPPDTQAHLKPEGAERLLLAAVLRDPDLALDAADRFVGPEDFAVFVHGLVFGVCRDLFRAARVAGPADVLAELQRRGQAAELGPAAGAFLFDLWNEAPTGAGAEYYAAQVRDAALRRRLRHAALEILSDTERPPTGPADEALAAAGAKLHDLLDRAAGRSDAVVGLDELLRGALGEVEARAAGTVPAAGLGSGFELLDALTGGFRPGQLVIVGARPGVGKTALLLAVLAHITRSGAPAFLASLEMPRQELGERLLAMGTGTKLHRIRTGRLGDADLERLSRANDPAVFGNAQLFADDTTHLTAERFGATVRTLVRRRGVRAAAIDYLQLLQPADRREPRVQQVGRMTRELKLAARQCGVPVLAACQLNRETESRGGPPRLSDLRESGSIEQDADVVILLHVPPGQHEECETLRVEAHVAKSRNGPTGTVPLVYRRTVVRFETDRRAA